MNILIIQNPYKHQGFSGGEIHTLQVANGMRDRGHSVFFAGSSPYLLAEAKKQGFETEEINFAGDEAVSEWPILKFFFTWRKIFANYKKFLQQCKKEKRINVLYLLSWNEKFLLPKFASKILGMKVIMVEHRLLERFIQKNPFKSWYVRNSKYATAVAVSEAVKKGLIELGISKSRIKVIYNGVDAEKFKKAQNVQQEVQENEKIIRIGTISRLSKDKGVNYLIDAIDEIVKKYPNVQFNIVGEGPDEAKIREKINRTKLERKIKLLGFIGHSKVVKFLSNLDIFIFAPTHGESFGIVLAEAGIMGVSCVSSNVGGTSEVIKDGETGFVVPPSNTEALAKAMLKLIEDKSLRRSMGEKARVRVLEKFTLEKMINSFAEIVEN